MNGGASVALKSVAEAEYGAIHGAKIATRMNAERDDEPDDRERPPQEPLAQQPPPARARVDRDRGGLGVAHAGAPATRMRGLSSE